MSTALCRCEAISKDYPDDDGSGRIPALEDITLEVLPGESLALIGRNGAGKSTLLKIIAGITRPSAGQVRRPRRTASVIELGAGFAPDLTGRENLELGLAMVALGTTMRRARADALSTLDDIGDALDTPVRHYSSGMLARLAFAIAFSAQPQLLLLDEVLSVGDLHFRDEVTTRVQDLLDRGGAVVFATHDLDLARTTCGTAIRLEEGTLRDRGTTGPVIDRYETSLMSVMRWQHDSNSRLTSLRVDPLTVAPGGSLRITLEITVAVPSHDLGVRIDVLPSIGDEPWQRAPDEGLVIREINTILRSDVLPLSGLEPGSHVLSARVDSFALSRSEVDLAAVLVDTRENQILDEISVTLTIGEGSGRPGLMVTIERIES